MQSRSVSNLAGTTSKAGSLVKHQTFTNNPQRRNEDMTDMTPKFDQNSHQQPNRNLGISASQKNITK